MKSLCTHSKIRNIILWDSWIFPIIHLDLHLGDIYTKREFSSKCSIVTDIFPVGSFLNVVESIIFTFFFFFLCLHLFGAIICYKIETWSQCLSIAWLVYRHYHKSFMISFGSHAIQTCYCQSLGMWSYMTMSANYPDLVKLPWSR